MAGPTRILLYAINGTGLGHLSRLLAVGRSVRELASASEHPVDVRIVTTSEAPSLAWDFPVYKFPSKTLANQNGLERRGFGKASKMLISNLVATFSPHLLVSDTLAEGSYGEMAFLRSYVGSAVFIDRHKDPAITSSEVYRRHVLLYDRILVPDHPERAEHYPLPTKAAQRRVFVGPIHGYRPDLSRQQARDYFQVPDQARLIYLSGGGGSDSREQLADLVSTLAADPRNFLLVGYGPLHRGEVVYRPNVIPLFTPDASRFFPGLDAAISAAGYNSYQELLAARVPTLFFAQVKGMDRQDQRVAHGLEAGWHGQIDLSAPAERHLVALEELLQRRADYVAKLEARPPAQGAWRAAAEILALAPGLSRPRLYTAALAGPDEELVAGQRRLFGWRRAACSSLAVTALEEEAVVAWRANGQAPRQPFVDFQAFGAELDGLGETLCKELLKAWCHDGPGGADYEAEQRRRLGEVLACLEEHFGAERQGVLETVLDRFKRPYQKTALNRLADRLDAGQDGRTLLAALAAEPAPLGARQLESILGEEIKR
ncbi:MAG: hypothetical protein AB7S38_11750 [Vulcanimicrobiota bacterium]